jgi:hypothetical protein
MAAGRRTNGSAAETSSEQSRAHGLRVMSGRDPDEQHRVATPFGVWPGPVTLQLFREGNPGDQVPGPMGLDRRTGDRVDHRVHIEALTQGIERWNAMHPRASPG